MATLFHAHVYEIFFPSSSSFNRQDSKNGDISAPKTLGPSMKSVLYSLTMSL